MFKNGAEGTFTCDSGADVTCLSRDAAERAGLKLRPLPHPFKVRAAGGQPMTPVGLVDVDMSVQLGMGALGGPLHWDRHFCLEDVLVLDSGEYIADTDLLIAWQDWGFNPAARQPPEEPLPNLAWMVLSGAEIYDTRRLTGPLPAPLEMSVSGVYVSQPQVAPVPTPAASGAPLRELMMAQVPVAMRSHPAVTRVVDGLAARYPDLGEQVEPESCPMWIEFKPVGEPKEVGFNVPTSRKVSVEEVRAKLEADIKRGVMERVPADTPAYGFALIVPKPGGKFRIVYNPVGINEATERIDPVGGVMPAHMIPEVWKLRRLKWACKLDLRDAFTIFRLGPEAQRLSTFMTQIGKIRHKSGWFGWHSFPIAFQKLMTEKVVMPTQEQFDGQAIAVLNWIDDFVLSADTPELLAQVLAAVIERIYELGGRLSLHKCELFVQKVSWCGCLVDLTTGCWMMDPERTNDLRNTKVPQNRTQLQQVLGLLRYYWQIVPGQEEHRKRLAELAKLDYHGVQLQGPKGKWTAEHTEIMKAACNAIADGDWLWVFDPTTELVIKTDASGEHGCCAVFCHYDPQTGKELPLAYYSHAWKGPQTLWPAQVKEAYAQRWALYSVADRYFRAARKIVLYCDNRNLAAMAESADPRVRRWQSDIRAYAGTVQRHWIPGEYNTIADYGSRVPHADPQAELTPEEENQWYVHALTVIGPGPSARKEERKQRLATAAKATASAPGTVVTIAGVAVTSAINVPRVLPRAAKAAVRKQSAKKVQFSDQAVSEQPSVGSSAAVAPVEAPLASGSTAAQAASVVSPQSAAAAAAPAVASLASGPTAASAVSVASPQSVAVRGVDADPDSAVASSVVPGHVAIHSFLVRISGAQQVAPEEERELWTGDGYRTETLGGMPVVVHHGRAVIPSTATDIKAELLHEVHDKQMHMAGSQRALKLLQDTAKVTWPGMPAAVKAYVRSCVRCQLANMDGPSKTGTLEPTLSLYPHHTWYTDVMGPLPGSKYVLSVVDAHSRCVKLRFMRTTTGAEAIEELEDVAQAWSTYPRVIRCDNGPPFNGHEFDAWCAENGIVLVRGVPHHSQGQGMVESRHRGIAHALVATLGRTAPADWGVKPHLGRIEFFLNALYSEPLGGSPHFIMYGREPHVPVSRVDWSNASEVSDALGVPRSFKEDDLLNIYAEGIAQMRSLQGLAALGSSVAQAITKGAYDASAKPSTFKVGDAVALYRFGTTKLEQRYVGPYRISRMESGGNVASLVSPFFDTDEVVARAHVSRLVHFDMSRATADEVGAALVEPGSFVVAEVLEHQMQPGGELLLHIRWLGNPLTTWQSALSLAKVEKVKRYCEAHGLSLAQPARPGRRAKK